MSKPKKRQYRYVAEAEIVDHDQVEISASSIDEAVKLAQAAFEEQNPGAMVQDLTVTRAGR
jgi:hypothetical protein